MSDDPKRGGEKAAIPITVVAGFLGAGKTTLLNHILTVEHGRRIGVLINDFGSINVDAELITEVGEGMIGLANGCICCSIRTDLIQSVLQLAGRPNPPEHIVIESSGVADPAGIVKSFLDPDLWSIVQLDGVITVIDAEQTPALPEREADLARRQAAGADLIVLNKVDLVDASTLARAHEWIASVRPGVQVFDATECRLPMEILLGTGAPRRNLSSPADALHVHVREVATSDDTRQQDNEHRHTHDLLFDTWAFTSLVPIELKLFQEVLGSLPREVFRVKGFIHAAERPGTRLTLNLVGRRATLSPAGPWGRDTPQTRLVFISRHDTVNYAGLEKALKGCKYQA
jgi:G3E family GTPase